MRDLGSSLRLTLIQDSFQFFNPLPKGSRKKNFTFLVLRFRLDLVDFMDTDQDKKWPIGEQLLLFQEM